MRKLIGLVLLFGGLGCAGSAAAHGKVSCDVSPAERRPQAELQRELQSQGWTVRKMEKHKGCYEVYGTDPNGKKVEDTLSLHDALPI